MNYFKRCFIALKIPIGMHLTDTIEYVKKELYNHKIKWTLDNDTHLTLHFLGNTSYKQIDIVKEILNQNAQNFKSFTLQIKGLGLFYQNKKPAIIWAGITQNEDLNNLFSLLESQLINHDFKLEKRPFKPHITIARIKYITSESTLKSNVLKYKNYHFQDTLIKELYFYESILQPQGAIYRPLTVLKF